MAIVMKERQFFNSMSKLENRFYEVNEVYVKYCNALQTEQSYRCIFSKDDNLELASDIIKVNPSLKDMQNNRFHFG